MPFGTVEDAGPYKERLNFLMRSSLSLVLSILILYPVMVPYSLITHYAFRITHYISCSVLKITSACISGEILVK